MIGLLCLLQACEKGIDGEGVVGVWEPVKRDFSGNWVFAEDGSFSDSDIQGSWEQVSDDKLLVNLRIDGTDFVFEFRFVETGRQLNLTMTKINDNRELVGPAAAAGGMPHVISFIRVG
ncbi:MAG: hypothetical protein R3F46_03775 [bacterium]